MSSLLTRRDFVTTCAALAFAGRVTADEPSFHLSTFQAEVTPPLKHPLMGGGIAPAAKIDDPLFVLGIVLHGGLGTVQVRGAGHRNDDAELIAPA